MHQATATPSRRAVLAGVGGTLGLLLTGCTVTDPAPPTISSTSKRRVLRLQTPAPSGSWDPVEASDLESQRIVRQSYDTLLGLDAQTGAPAAGLAQSWNVSDDGLVYELTLRPGLLFHDGSSLDAEAVALNVQRWAALGTSTDPAVAHIATLFDTAQDSKDSTPTPAKTPAATEEPQSTAGTQAPAASPDPAPVAQLNAPDPLSDANSKAPSQIIKVEAVNEVTVRIVLSRRVTPLIQALTHPCFGIVSPQALREAKATKGRSKTGALRRASAGSGPFSAAMDENTVVLTAHKDHFLGAPQLDEVRLTPQTSSVRRMWDLINQHSDGFDLVTVDSLKQLYQDTQQVLQRDPFSMAYIGLNQANRWLADERFRRAVAHAIDRGSLLDGIFITSSKTALSPLPPALGVADPHSPYGHDTDKAKRLLAECEYKGEAIPFVYPTDVARPYLPMPERVYALLSGQLGAAGITIKPVGVPWDDGYFEAVQSGEHAGLHLLGVQGTFRDPENFLGRLFARKNKQLAYDSPEVRRRVRVARALPDGPERLAAYADIVELITVDAAILPLVYPISALAMAPSIGSYPVSPVLDEPLNRVTLT